MILKKKNQKSINKPLYKKFQKLFENVQSREKIFNFKNQKWKALIDRLKKRKFYYSYKYKRQKKKIFLFDYSGNNIVPKKAYFNLPKFNKHYYKYKMQLAKKISLFYGNLKKTNMRKIIKKLWKKKIYTKKLPFKKTYDFYFFEFMERRLESILYRSFFTKSIKSARQLIMHGHVFVNNQIIRNGSYLVNNNDIIKINPKFYKFIINNIKKSTCWPIQINSLTINYKTLQILYSTPFYFNAFLNLFSFPIKIKTALHYYKYN